MIKYKVNSQGFSNNKPVVFPDSQKGKEKAK
jgi:hypothetical protein